MEYKSSQGTTTQIGRMRAYLEDREVSENIQKAWLYWARALLLFHDSRPPESLRLTDVKAFLDHLDASRRLTPVSRRQAMKAIECLLVHVLGADVPGLEEMVARCQRQHRPVVLSPRQVQALLSQLHGANWLMASLVYGAGLRLKECVRLRVRDIEADRIVIRESSGRFSRDSVLPRRVRPQLREHLEDLKLQHIREMADGLGAVLLPSGMYPEKATSRSWVWQFLFPAPYSAVAAGEGIDRVRGHVSDTDLAGAIEKAARKAGIQTPITTNTLRNSFAAHLIQRGVAVSDVERLLGIKRRAESDTEQQPAPVSIPTSPADLLATH